MNLLLAALRLIHIVSAFTWFGLGLVMTFYVAPAALAAGESGFRFFRSMYVNTRFATSIAAAAGLTTLAGIVLYIIGGVGTHFSSTGNVVLSIGAVAGLLAAGHGGMATTKATTEYGAALAEYVADNQPISAEGAATLRERAAKLATSSRLSFIMMAIALLGMASARYL